MHRIDEIDVHILNKLMNNSRTSFSEIAKECRISTNSIRMRFSRLMKNEIITGSTIIVNPKILGYEGTAYLAITSVMDKEQDVLEFLKEVPTIAMAKPQIGRHNIVCILYVKKLDELVETMDIVKSNPHVVEVDTAISTNTSSIFHFENLIIAPYDDLKKTRLQSRNKAKKISTDSRGVALSHSEHYFNASAIELDRIDALMIKQLSMDSRVSFRKLAKKLGISTKTAIIRFERLEKELRPHYTITLNLNKIGYTCNIIFAIKVSSQANAENVYKKIIRIPNIIIATKCTGGIDILAIAPFANFDQLINWKKKITKISGIIKAEILLDKTFDNWPSDMFFKLL